MGLKEQLVLLETSKFMVIYYGYKRKVAYSHIYLSIDICIISLF